MNPLLALHVAEHVRNEVREHPKRWGCLALFLLFGPAIACVLVAILIIVVIAGGADGSSSAPGHVPGVPDVMLTAYQQAAQRIDGIRPACAGMRWSILAGIAEVESRHASGRTIAPNGDISPPIQRAAHHAISVIMIDELALGHAAGRAPVSEVDRQPFSDLGDFRPARRGLAPPRRTALTSPSASRGPAPGLDRPAGQHEHRHQPELPLAVPRPTRRTTDAPQVTRHAGDRARRPHHHRTHRGHRTPRPDHSGPCGRRRTRLPPRHHHQNRRESRNHLEPIRRR